MIPVVKENTRLKLALAIHTGATLTLAKEIIDILPLVPDKIIKALSKLSKAAVYLFIFYSLFFFLKCLH